MMNLERTLEILSELGKVSSSELTQEDINKIEESTGKKARIINTDREYLILK